MAAPGPLASRLAWTVPGLAALGTGLYFCAADGWRYVIDARLLFGHGYLLFAFTPVVFGTFAVLSALRWGSRGLVFAFATAVSCDAAQALFAPYVNAQVVQLFTESYAVEPVFWVLALVLCWRLLRPLKVKLVTPWSVGLLFVWLLATHFKAWIGTEVMIEPLTEVSWIVCAVKSVDGL